MLKRAIGYLMLFAICITTSAVVVLTQEPFRPVEGSNLAEKLARIVRQSETKSARTPFWTAYTFDVRTGAAVGIGIPPEFQGRVESFAGTEVLFGTLNGPAANTLNLAIFSLHSAGSASVTRLEICNLDQQQRPSDSHPVYWLGHATKDESLNDMRQLAESGQSTEVRAQATLAIALHDDPRVNETLKNLVRKSTDSEVRAIVIAWLGQLKTDREFLADLGRQASGPEIRIQTIKAIGRDKNGDTFATLRSLYRPDLTTNVKMALIDEIANARDRDAVAPFLLDLEQHDPSPEIKQHAIYTLRRFDSNSTIDELMRLLQTEQDEDFKNQIIYAFSQMKNPRSLEKLFEIARQNDNPRIRRQARFWIQQRISTRIATELPKGGKKDDPFEAKAERIMKEQSSSEAVTTFIQIAKTNRDLRLQQWAIFYLSKLDDPRVVEFYQELLSR